MTDAFCHVWNVDCLFCGQREFVRLVEIWDGHEFQLETCCEASHEAMAAEMASDPDFATHIMGLVNAGPVMGADLRRVAFTDGGCGPVLLDWHLRVRSIAQPKAIAFVAKHHAHNGPLTIDRFRGGIWNGRTLVGVVQVGNCCARAYNGKGVLEVRRLCVDRSLPSELRWKACSAGYTWAAQEAERLGWERLITYTTESESGMSLRYARWKCESAASRAGKLWPDRLDGRQRKNVGQAEAKVRWSKSLRPSATAVAQRVWREGGSKRVPIGQIAMAALWERSAA